MKIFRREFSLIGANFSDIWHTVIAMNMLTEATLRQLLQEHILVPFDIVQIEPFEAELDSDGKPISQRDSYRRLFEGRLARLREAAPNRTDIHDQHVAVLRALDAVDSTEPFYYWTARSQTRQYFGASTIRCVVSCFSHSHPPDQKNLPPEI